MSAVDWHNDANCQGHEGEFWPAEGHMNVKFCKAICRGCPVRLMCLDWAMANEAGQQPEFRSSMYGGLTPSERSRLDKSGRHRPQALAGAR